MTTPAYVPPQPQYSQPQYSQPQYQPYAQDAHPQQYQPQQYQPQQQYPPQQYPPQQYPPQQDPPQQYQPPPLQQYPPQQQQQYPPQQQYPQQQQYAPQQQAQSAGPVSGGSDAHAPVGVPASAALRLSAQKIMTDGLFDCFADIETFLCAWFVPCIAIGRNAERAGLGDCFARGCVFGCLLYSCFCIPCAIAYAADLRASFFTRLDLPDPGLPTNCAIYTCCPVCALAQEGRASKLMMLAAALPPQGVLMTRA